LSERRDLRRIERRGGDDRVEMTDLSEKINALIGGSTSDLEQIEHTLTDGYASALALEAEQWRLEKQISDVTVRLQCGDLEQKANELSALRKRLDGATGELVRLRAQLVHLRRRAADVRV
jgi:predicted  nucleic acid-binding Zn-ribbon protein